VTTFQSWHHLFLVNEHSQAGITINKCCSHLKGDIVEALQCLKCSIHNDLLFHVAPTSTVELDGEDEPECRDSDPSDDTAHPSWDIVLEDGEDDDI